LEALKIQRAQLTGNHYSNQELEICLADTFMDEYSVPMIRLCIKCGYANMFNGKTLVQICFHCNEKFCFHCLRNITLNNDTFHKNEYQCEQKQAARQTNEQRNPIYM